MARLLLFAWMLMLGLGGVARAAPSSGSVLWKFEAGGPIWGSLTHEDGMLYFGSGDGNLYALEIATRQLKWKVATRGGIRSRPAVAGDLVFAASDDGFLPGTPVSGPSSR